MGIYFAGDAQFTGCRIAMVVGARSLATCLSERREVLRDDWTRDVAPVIWVRRVPAAGAVRELFRGQPVQAGLLRRADSVATGAAAVVSWLRRERGAAAPLPPAPVVDSFCVGEACDVAGRRQMLFLDIEEALVDEFVDAEGA